MQEEVENCPLHFFFSFFSRAHQITYFKSICFCSWYLYCISGKKKRKADTRPLTRVSSEKKSGKPQTSHLD